MEKAIEDLTLLLIHLTSWRGGGDPESFDLPESWKGYDFHMLDALEEGGYIVSGSRRSSKTVTLTEDGLREARRLEESFLYSAGGKYRRHDAEARMKARRDVEFFCERCQCLVGTPSVYYEPFESYREGKMPREKIVELLRRYHLKHWHTDATKVYRRRVTYNVQRGMELTDAAKEAREFAQRMVPGQDPH